MNFLKFDSSDDEEQVKIKVEPEATPEEPQSGAPVFKPKLDQKRTKRYTDDLPSSNAPLIKTNQTRKYTQEAPELIGPFSHGPSMSKTATSKSSNSKPTPPKFDPRFSTPIGGSVVGHKSTLEPVRKLESISASVKFTSDDSVDTFNPWEKLRNEQEVLTDDYKHLSVDSGNTYIPESTMFNSVAKNCISNNTNLFFQFPSAFPEYDGDEGIIGKVVVYKSGKSVLKVGDICFDIDVSQKPRYHSCLATVDGKESLIFTGKVERNLVCTPSLTSIT